MKPLYVSYTGVAPEGDATLTTAEDVDSVLDGVREWVGSTGALLMMIGFVDGDEDSPLLQAGVNGDRGLLTYEGPDAPEGLLSDGKPEATGNSKRANAKRASAANEAVSYFFQGTEAEFPRTAEVPFATVKEAVREFLVSEGKQPTTVAWRPDVED